jgi:hypothetical protein
MDRFVSVTAFMRVIDGGRSMKAGILPRMIFLADAEDLSPEPVLGAAQRAPSNRHDGARAGYPILLAGKSASGSRGARLEKLLESRTEPPPRNSKKNFAVVSGGKSN